MLRRFMSTFILTISLGYLLLLHFQDTDTTLYLTLWFASTLATLTYTIGRSRSNAYLAATSGVLAGICGIIVINNILNMLITNIDFSLLFLTSFSITSGLLTGYLLAPRR